MTGKPLTYEITDEQASTLGEVADDWWKDGTPSGRPKSGEWPDAEVLQFAVFLRRRVFFDALSGGNASFIKDTV